MITTIAYVGWLVLFAVTWLATKPARVEADPATMELGAEPPAVVNLLTRGWRLRREAIAATLLDLAARNVVALEQIGPQPERTIVRLHRTDGADLTPYERRVLDRVQRLARDGQVPASALARGSQAQARAWWRRFRREVHADARARGLSRDRWGSSLRTLLYGAAFVPAGLTLFESSLRNAVAVYVGLALLVEGSTSQRDTPAGRTAAAHWLGVRAHVGSDVTFPGQPPAAVKIWGRFLSYGAAFGVAEAAVAVLSFGAESMKSAWSTYGGVWHRVTVRYPRPSDRWGGRRPGRVAAGKIVSAVLVGAVGVALLYVAFTQPFVRDRRTLLLAAAAAVFALAAWSVVIGVRAILDATERRQMDGEVVRLRRVNRGDDDNPRYVYYAAIDPGGVKRVRAYVVSAEIYAVLTQHDIVRVTMGARLGYVWDATVTEAAPEIFAADEADDDETSLVEKLNAVVNDYEDRRDVYHDPDRTKPGLEGALLSTVWSHLETKAKGESTDLGGLVTADDAAAALGGPVTVQDSPSLPLVNQSTSIYTAGNRTLMVQAVSGKLISRLMSRARRGERLTEVEGEAYLTGSAVVVLHDNVGVTLTLRGAPKGAARETLTPLAAIVARRLAGRDRESQP